MDGHALARKFGICVHSARLDLCDEGSPAEVFVAITYSKATILGETETVRTKTVAARGDPVWEEELTLFALHTPPLSPIQCPHTSAHPPHAQHHGPRGAVHHGHGAPEAAARDEGARHGRGPRGRHHRRPAHRVVRACAPRPQPPCRACRRTANTARAAAERGPRAVRAVPHRHRRAHAPAPPRHRAAVRTVARASFCSPCDAAHAAHAVPAPVRARRRPCARPQPL